MSRIAEMLRSRRMPQVAVLTLLSVGFAGCSADMQTRFSDSSFSNPFASQPEATGSVRPPAVERRELPQYSRPPQTQFPQYQSQDLSRLDKTHLAMRVKERQVGKSSGNLHPF